jgi:hypothetical protein
MDIGKTVSISSYGEYSSGNYGINSLCVEIGRLTLYFSYKTIIAFRDNGILTISRNSWGPTTGRHLNIISPDKDMRLPRGEFEQVLTETLKKYRVI